MRIKDGYLLRNIAGNHVVVPVENADFDGIIRLNETGVILWKALEKGSSEDLLVKALLDEYKVDIATAEKDVSLFLSKLKSADILDK